MDTLFVAILAALVYTFPLFVLIHYRNQTPYGKFFMAFALFFVVPVLGWFYALYVGLKEWDC